MARDGGRAPGSLDVLSGRGEVTGSQAEREGWACHSGTADAPPESREREAIPQITNMRRIPFHK